MKRYKFLLSLATILVLVIIVLLLPKRRDSQTPEPPRIGVRRVTPEPTRIPEANLIVVSQKPDRTLNINYADFKQGGLIKITRLNQEIGQSEGLTGIKENFTIELTTDTKDGDTLTVILLDKDGQEVEKKDILITTTVVAPGVLLPKDLQSQ